MTTLASIRANLDRLKSYTAIERIKNIVSTTTHPDELDLLATALTNLAVEIEALPPHTEEPHAQN